MRAILNRLCGLLAVGASAAAFADVVAPAGLPGLILYEPPAFPLSLSPTPIVDGYATAILTVNAEGHVDDALVVEASHPAFGDTVLKAVSAWQLAPATSATVPRREVIRFAFRREGTVLSMSHAQAAEYQFPAGTDSLRSVSWEELSSPPARLASAKPAYPRQGQTAAAGANAVVNFVIDPQGQVRVPVIVSTTDAAFGDAALAAVKQWRYAPPLHDGDPVSVVVAQSFTYGPAAGR